MGPAARGCREGVSGIASTQFEALSRISHRDRREGRKGLKIPGAWRAGRCRHAWRYVGRGKRVYPGDSATYVAAADYGEQSGLNTPEIVERRHPGSLPG